MVSIIVIKIQFKFFFPARSKQSLFNIACSYNCIAKEDGMAEWSPKKNTIHVEELILNYIMGSAWCNQMTMLEALINNNVNYYQ